MKLPAIQLSLLESASADEAIQITHLATELDEDEVTVTRAAFELAEEGLLSIEESVVEEIVLTSEGQKYLDVGLPENRLLASAAALGGSEAQIPMDQVIDNADLTGEEVNIALSNYARKGYGSIENGSIVVDASIEQSDGLSDPEETVLEQIHEGAANTPSSDVLDQLESRGLINRIERTIRAIKLTDAGVTALMEGIEVAETIGAVTPDLLTSGEWRDVEFSAYNVEAEAEQLHGGKEHILRQTANRVKDVLVGMGFKEMEGPHADAQFWINDCLFMPQDHPARTHWDQFELDLPPMDELPKDLLKRVESAHRNGVGPDGEGYHSPWNESVAKRVDLRGHTTSLSMRYLSGNAVGDLEPPERYFSVEKVYRNDTLDPTHLLEFFQIEGWVMAENLSVRDLMGTFTAFYEQFGITDLEFKPHYNPYTEPSFELFGEHPETGDLIEVGNSGMFRDEVLDPLGVDCDVMAWGLALERLLMLMYGFEDIRDVHGTLCDLDLLRSVEVVK